MRKGRERGRGRKEGEGAGQQQPGFTRPGARRASRLSGHPSGPVCPRAARKPGAHAQPGPPLEGPVYVAAGRLAPPRRPRARLRAARAPSACRRPRSLGGFGRRQGRGHAGRGQARSGDLRQAGRRRQLVAILGEGG